MRGHRDVCSAHVTVPVMAQRMNHDPDQLESFSVDLVPGVESEPTLASPVGQGLSLWPGRCEPGLETAFVCDRESWLGQATDAPRGRRRSPAGRLVDLPTTTDSSAFAASDARKAATVPAWGCGVLQGLLRRADSGPQVGDELTLQRCISAQQVEARRRHYIDLRQHWLNRCKWRMSRPSSVCDCPTVGWQSPNSSCPNRDWTLTLSGPCNASWLSKWMPSTPVGSLGHRHPT